MKSILAFVATCCFCATFSLASPSSSLVSARRAQVLLGNEEWSQVIRVENSGTSTRYPRTVYALVFELVGVLWFYTDCEGTQYLSTHRGRLVEDKASVGTLLLRLHPGFKHWSAVRAESDSGAIRSTPLPNGCFIESVACLRQRLIAGNTVKHPRILCFFKESCRSYVGHAVLAFDTTEGVAVIDPADPSRSRIYSGQIAETAQSLGCALFGGAVKRALWVPLNDFASDLSSRYASIKKAQDKVVN